MGEGFLGACVDTSIPSTYFSNLVLWFFLANAKLCPRRPLLLQGHSEGNRWKKKKENSS
jgi:hypothetical protein